MCYELQTAIRDSGIQEAIQAEDIIQEQLHKVWGSTGVTARNEVAHLGQPVNHHQYGIEARESSGSPVMKSNIIKVMEV